MNPKNPQAAGEGLFNCAVPSEYVRTHGQDGDMWVRLHVALDALSAPANAVTVDDAMVERAMRAYSDEAHKEGFSRPNGDGMDWHKRWMRAALTAALAPAAPATKRVIVDYNYNGDAVFGDAPADPPAAGDDEAELIEQVREAIAGTPELWNEYSHINDAQFNAIKARVVELIRQRLAAQEAAK